MGLSILALQSLHMFLLGCRIGACQWSERTLKEEWWERGPWARHPTPAPARETSKATPCQRGLQPRRAQGSFLETFTPTLSEMTEVSGIFQEPHVRTHSWWGEGWSSRGVVKSSRPPSPPAAVSSDPRPRVSTGWGEFPPDGQAQLPPQQGYPCERGRRPPGATPASLPPPPPPPRWPGRLWK